MIRENLFEKYNLIEKSIERLRQFCPPEGYYLAFSGGKDSVVCKELLILSGCKYDAHYKMTTIDPPELVRFIFDSHPDVKIEKPKEPFLKALVKRGFPQRGRRWCCEYLKESGGSGRKIVTGIRWAESSRRAQRKSVEYCLKDKSKIYINPIIDWSDADVWEFIKLKNIPYCKLYDEGWRRIGCLFCPMAGKHRLIELSLYPKFEKAFRKAFQNLYDAKKIRGTSVDRWRDGDDMFDWWMREDRTIEDDPDQQIIFE